MLTLGSSTSTLRVARRTDETTCPALCHDATRLGSAVAIVHSAFETPVAWTVGVNPAKEGSTYRRKNSNTAGGVGAPPVDSDWTRPPSILENC